jgi:hypothetical protein
MDFWRLLIGKELGLGRGCHWMLGSGINRWLREGGALTTYTIVIY